MTLPKTNMAYEVIYFSKKERIVSQPTLVGFHVTPMKELYGTFVPKLIIESKVATPMRYVGLCLGESVEVEGKKHNPDSLEAVEIINADSKLGFYIRFMANFLKSQAIDSEWQ